MEILLFVAGVILGFITNMITNEMAARRQARVAAAANEEKYAGLVGVYVAFALDEEKINFDDPRGECRIEYAGGNILTLHYKEIKNDHVWEAEIWMASPFTGSMVWRYIRLFGTEPTPIHRFGFKRCATFEKLGRNGEMRKYFYLIGEDGFGKEALEKK